MTSTSIKKLLIIIPYRDRADHIKEFIPYIHNTLTSQNIPYKTVAVEQSPEKLFNRGLLCNIGFDLYQDSCDYICIHDVDIIGENFDYTYEPVVTHLSARYKDRNYKEFYARCLGGVCLFTKEDYIKVNGFSNEYWGWGAEDDDLRLRCDVADVKVQRKQGRFRSLHHTKISRADRPLKSPGYIDNVKKLNIFKKQNHEEQIKTLNENGLSNVKNYYSIKQVIEYERYDMVQVSVI